MPEIADVRPLARVHTIDLSGHAYLRDVSALANVHTLEIHRIEPPRLTGTIFFG